MFTANVTGIREIFIFLYVALFMLLQIFQQFCGEVTLFTVIPNFLVCLYVGDNSPFLLNQRPHLGYMHL